MGAHVGGLEECQEEAHGAYAAAEARAGAQLQAAACGEAYSRSSVVCLIVTYLLRRWERAEEARERAEEEACGTNATAEARTGAQTQALPAGAALSMEEKLASRRQIFAPREACKCAAAAICSTLPLPCTRWPPLARHTVSLHTRGGVRAITACS